MIVLEFGGVVQAAAGCDLSIGIRFLGLAAAIMPRQVGFETHQRNNNVHPFFGKCSRDGGGICNA
jgi:hypothetical protein